MDLNLILMLTATGITGFGVGLFIARQVSNTYRRPKLQCLDYEDYEHTQTPGLSHRWPSPANLGKGHGTQDQNSSHSSPTEAQKEYELHRVMWEYSPYNPANHKGWCGAPIGMACTCDDDDDYHN